MQIQISKLIMAETEKAVKVYNNKLTPVWLPKSKIEISGQRVILIPDWLANDKDLNPVKKNDSDIPEIPKVKVEEEDNENDSTQEEALSVVEQLGITFSSIDFSNKSVSIELNSNPGKVYKRKLHINRGRFFFAFKTRIFQITSFDSMDNTIIALKDLGVYTKESFKDLEIDEENATVKVEVETDAKHKEHETIKLCIENDIPVYLVGPAGSGKNFTLQEIAEELEMDFYFTNSVQQEYKITGFIDAGGKYHSTEFRKAFENGGLFFLDELDASIPEILVLLNAAIANRYFEFPDGKINAHPQFRVVAAGNTVGDGADEQYTGRLILDQATLDRFVIIHFDYDRKVELMLAKGNVELVNFIEELREVTKEIGIRATFSYRAIITIVKLEGNMKLDKLLLIGVFKGIDKDTIKTIQAKDPNNKYWKAFNTLKKVS